MAYKPEEIKEIFNEICSRIEKGESLRSVLRSNNMPSSSTFFIWVDGDQDKSKQYARATEIRAESMFDEMLEIADKQDADITITPKGDEITNHNVIARSRLQVDTRKWALSKMNPKKYGDKLGLDHSGEIKRTDCPNLSNLTEEEIISLGKLRKKANGIND